LPRNQKRMKIWKKYSHDEIKQRVFDALSKNVNYSKENVLGIPASYLDDKVFNQDDAFLQNAPYISTLVQNPNHIGCHTLGKSESFFKGTQAIEREVIEICSADILGGELGEFDGYVASGGTEANMQAIWVYRNYFVREHNASLSEIAILTSADRHYSMDKAGNVFNISVYHTAVDEANRSICQFEVEKTIQTAQADGKKYFIVVANMMTTMFGSVDTVDEYVIALKSSGVHYRIHVDGAYGGFYYPFTDGSTKLNFSNPEISSVTLDAHKMAQAPYGTGIFVIRKGLIHYAHTKEASYVEGEDYTLIGSRSGANAIAIWMILVKNGPYGWKEKVYILQKRAEWMCQELEKRGIEYYRHGRSNIITMRSKYVSTEIAHEFGLVPDNHSYPIWYKIVIMEHVTLEKMIPLLERL